MGSRLVAQLYGRTTVPSDRRTSSQAAVQRVLREREALRRLLVDVDAEAGPLVRPERTIVDLGTTREHLASGIVEQVSLLDPEVRAGQVELEVGRVAHR